jgi:hypothetical protein
MNHAHSKYHPVPTCDNGDLCTNPATVTIVLPGLTPQGNETKHQLLLCKTCAALLNEIESAPIQYDRPDTYRSTVRGSRFG